MSETLLAVEDLKKTFVLRSQNGRKQLLRAVDGVSFTIARGETLGLVGESGCGKSTLGRCVLRLLEPDAGRVVFDGAELGQGKDLRAVRKRMQIIFQNPAGSLDPRMTVGDVVAEGLRIHRIGKSARGREALVSRLLEEVGLLPEYASRYPTELSGGQQQRVGIARALAVGPELLVCDECVSALDLSYQWQIVELLQRLKSERGLSYLFISHDLPVVRLISDRIAVMLLGRFVELAAADELTEAPAHPYTQALLAASPVPDPAAAGQRKRASAVFPEEGTEPGGRGCPYAARCPCAGALCRKETPALREISPGHFCACHMA